MALFEIMKALTRAAMAHYKKTRCWVVVDRDGKNLDVALTVPDYSPTQEDLIAGERHFGKLKVSDIDVSRL